jgi:hypothetical protein
MSEVQTPESVPGTAPTQPTQVAVAVRDTDLEILYANFFRVTGNPDEVLLDLGMFSQVMTPSGMEPVNMTHRVVLTIVTAKKLTEVMRAVMARYEQVYGVVEVDHNRRVRG